MSNYSEKLKDPRWQKKRLEVLERDNWKCQNCGDEESTLAVHHLYYEKGKEPWDYPLEAFKTLCEVCHEEEHSSRKEYECLLLEILREKGFSASDVFFMAEGFSSLTMQSTPNNTSSAITWLLKDDERMKDVINFYVALINHSRRGGDRAILEKV